MSENRSIVEGMNWTARGELAKVAMLRLSWCRSSSSSLRLRPRATAWSVMPYVACRMVALLRHHVLHLDCPIEAHVVWSESETIFEPTIFGLHHKQCCRTTLCNCSWLLLLVVLFLVHLCATVESPASFIVNFLTAFCC